MYDTIRNDSRTLTSEMLKLHEELAVLRSRELDEDLDRRILYMRSFGTEKARMTALRKPVGMTVAEFREWEPEERPEAEEVVMEAVRGMARSTRRLGR